MLQLLRRIYKDNATTVEQRLSHNISLFDPSIILHENCGGDLVVLKKLSNLSNFTWNDAFDHNSLCTHTHQLKAAFGWFGMENAQACADRVHHDLRSMKESKEINVLKQYAHSMNVEINMLLQNIDAELNSD